MSTVVRTRAAAETSPHPVAAAATALARDPADFAGALALLAGLGIPARLYSEDGAAIAPSGPPLPPETLRDVRVQGWASGRRVQPLLVEGQLVGALAFEVDVAPEIEAGVASVFALARAPRNAVDARLRRRLVESGRMAALGELVTGLAHEINNPLFAILGLLEFLLKDAEPGTKTHERLLLVQESGLEIKEIVRALLDFGREPTEGFVAVDLRDLSASAVTLLRRTNADKGLDIVESYPEDPIWVRAVPGQLKQLVLNLVSNARHATDGNGRAVVEVRQDGDAAILAVSDDGPGVPDHLHGRIFEPFFSTRRDAGGSGLGLSACHGIASLHGGELTVENGVDGGACFRLRLPTSDPS